MKIFISMAAAIFLMGVAAPLTSTAGFFGDLEKSVKAQENKSLANSAKTTKTPLTIKELLIAENNRFLTTTQKDLMQFSRETMAGCLTPIMASGNAIGDSWGISARGTDSSSGVSRTTIDVIAFKQRLNNKYPPMFDALTEKILRGDDMCPHHTKKLLKNRDNNSSTMFCVMQKYDNIIRSIEQDQRIFALNMQTKGMGGDAERISTQASNIVDADVLEGWFNTAQNSLPGMYQQHLIDRSVYWQINKPGSSFSCNTGYGTIVQNANITDIYIGYTIVQSNVFWENANIKYTYTYNNDRLLENITGRIDYGSMSASYKQSFNALPEITALNLDASFTATKAKNGIWDNNISINQLIPQVQYIYQNLQPELWKIYHPGEAFQPASIRDFLYSMMTSPEMRTTVIKMAVKIKNSKQGGI